MTIKIISICGYSGSGKTLYSKIISNKFSNSYILSTDRYYKSVPKNVDITTYDFDNPNAIDINKLYSDIKKLKTGEKVNIPDYDFINHERTSKVDTINLVNDGVLIIEGIFLLSLEWIRNISDIMVFIDVHEETCFKRRLDRDVKERGMDKKEIIEQYLGSVKPSQERFIKPYIKFATIKIDNNDNLYNIEIPNSIINLL